MIAFLEGEVALLEEEAVVLDVRGVGYRVHTSSGSVTAVAVGETHRFYTYQHVREEALVLYGFLHDLERRLFVRLQSATGVGPKLALQMFNHLTAGQIVQALRLEDARTLSRVPGIGAKTASRMGLELKDRLDDLTTWSDEAERAPQNRPVALMQQGLFPESLKDVMEALTALGYHERETATVLAEFQSELVAMTPGNAVKRALRELSRG